MRIVKKVLFFLAFFSWQAAYGQDGPAVFEALAGTGAAGVVLKASGEPVLLPDCRGVVWERFDADTRRYTPLPQAPCGPAKAAIRVDANGLPFPAPAAGAGFSVVRPTAVVGVGCKPDLPLELAGCARLVPVVGPNVSLQGENR